ncbi:MAG: uroporphyrinogen decarboxylase family protein [Chloroflexota bacterium]|nr:MAG: uroporphyrinogen decarboxylase [Bellilinea sp.]
MTTFSLTPRQRVYTALRHETPDRVPTALGGGPYGLVDDLYFRLLDFFQLGEAVPPFRQGHNISYMDDRLLSRLGTDFRYCWPAKLPNSPVIPGEDENTFFDSFGQIWKRALPYYYAGNGLLQHTTNIEDIERLVRWPDPRDPSWMQGVAQRAEELQRNTPYFIVMRMVASHGPFQTACDLRGTENFLTDLIEYPDFALTLLDRITTLLEGLLDAAMRAGGRWFDMIELPGDDYAGNSGPILSPAMFRRFIKPCLARMIHTIRAHKPDIKIMLHSDGAVARLIPDFIELGVDVLHPLEPLPATNISEIKQKYGDRISFLGGIDISHAMLGSREDVIQEVKTRLAQLAEGGGYILAPANHLQADVPAENVVTLFQAAQHWGKYPLALSSSP